MRVWEDIPKAFGGAEGPSFGTVDDREAFQYFYEARQRSLSIITKCGKHGSPEMRHHTDEKFPQVLADAPYWESKCMEDEKFKAFASKASLLANHALRARHHTTTFMLTRVACFCVVGST